MAKVDTYQAVKFEQLAVANHSNVLYYSRDKYSSVLARKLKPEFARFFVSSELKDCLKLLQKITNDKVDSTCVDIVIVEADSAALKLVDYINKRPNSPETSSCPLIPVILLLNDNTDPDYLENVRNVGNVNKVIRMPTKSKNILFGIIETLHMRNRVEETFKDLKKQRIITSKYPYLPIFDDGHNATTSGGGNNNNLPNNNSTMNSGKKPNRGDFEMSGSLTSSHDYKRRNYGQVEEIDDGTECSSLLPNFVTTTRIASPQQYDLRKGKENFNTMFLASKFDHLDELVTKEIVDLEIANNDRQKAHEQSVIRKQEILRQSQMDMSTEIAQAQAAAKAVEAGMAGGKGPTLGDVLSNINNKETIQGKKQPRRTRHLGSMEALADERNPIDDDDRTHLPRGNTLTNLKDAMKTESKSGVLGGAMDGSGTGNKFTTHDHSQQRKYTSSEKALMLLDPRCRPNWNGTASPSVAVPSARHHKHHHSDDEEDEDTLPVANNDIYPFINKPTPKIHVQYTVGGLEKRVAEGHWKALNRINLNRSSSVSSPTHKTSQGSQSRSRTASQETSDHLPRINSTTFDSLPNSPSKPRPHSSNAAHTGTAAASRSNSIFAAAGSGGGKVNQDRPKTGIATGTMNMLAAASASVRLATAASAASKINTTESATAAASAPVDTVNAAATDGAVASTTTTDTTAATGGDSATTATDPADSPITSAVRKAMGRISFQTTAKAIGKCMHLHVDTQYNSIYNSLEASVVTPQPVSIKDKPIVGTVESKDNRLRTSSKDSTFGKIRPKTATDYSASANKKNAVSASIQALADSTKATLRAAKVAERNILKMTHDKPFDIQVSALLTLDLYNRKINLGERDLLEKGLKLEADGDFENATVCFTRAGTHSKDPHIAKMLTGALNYNRGRLMAALKFFTVAIDMLENKPDHSRINEDEFVAYHNRGIINFRLGNDESGLNDIEQAVKLNPSHMPTREVMSLAKRRMGKFAAAISDAIANKTLRNDLKRNNIIEQMEKQVDRRVSVFESGTRVDPRFALLDKIYNDELPTLAAIEAAEKTLSRKNSNASIHTHNSHGSQNASPGMSTVLKSQLSPSTTVTKGVKFQDDTKDTQNAPPIFSNHGTSGPHDNPSAGGMGNLIHTVSRVQNNGSPRSLVVTNNNNKTASPRGMDMRASIYTAMTSDSSASGTVDNILKTRGYCLEIPDYTCNNSLKDKVREQQNRLKSEMIGEDDNEGSFLKIFKMNHGYKFELFDDLFIKPNELQVALLLEPNKRLVHHIEVIATTLRLFPFLRGLSDSSISDLATVIEYRALTSHDEIFAQNMPSSAMCLLLKGQIQVKMLNQLSTISEDILLGELPQYATFGHIDFLFRHTNASIVKELEEILYPKVSNNKSGGGGGGMNDSFMSSRGSHFAGGAACAGFNNSMDKGFDSMEAAGDKDEYGGPMAVGESLLARKLISGEDLDRSLASGMFKSYTMYSQCELLMIAEKDFERVLLSAALDELKRRLEAITSSCIFESWSRNDHIRLARMGQIRTFKRGETILAQGTKPSFLFIIMKGMCKVTKRPNRTEMLVQKLQIAKDKAERHDLKYTYHHKLRNTLTKASQPIPTRLTVDGTIAAANHFARQNSSGNSSSGIASGYQTPTTATPKNRSNSAVPKSAGPNRDNAKQSKHIPKRTTRPSTAAAGTPKGIETRLTGSQELRRLCNTTDSLSLDGLGEDSVVTETLYQTEAERIRYDLQQEIYRLEALIQRAMVYDTHDNGTTHYNTSHNSSAYNVNDSNSLATGSSESGSTPFQSASSTPANIRKPLQHMTSFSQRSMGSKSHSNMPISLDDVCEETILKSKVAEIATLQWPMIFGEACILDPDNGRSRGTITADTACDVFVLHKTQIQTFAVDDRFLEKVKAKATLYPGDPDIVVSLFRKQEWKQYKTEVMQSIPKDRWPMKIAQYEPFNV